MKTSTGGKGDTHQTRQAGREQRFGGNGRGRRDRLGKRGGHHKGIPEDKNRNISSETISG
jgi:hypothetical protein